MPRVAVFIDDANMSANSDKRHIDWRVLRRWASWLVPYIFQEGGRDGTQRGLCPGQPFSTGNLKER